MTVDELLEQIDDMIDKAWSFPRGKCLVEADRLRDLITSMGYILEDTPQGAKVRKA